MNLRRALPLLTALAALLAAGPVAIAAARPPCMSRGSLAATASAATPHGCCPRPAAGLVTGGDCCKLGAPAPAPGPAPASERAPLPAIACAAPVAFTPAFTPRAPADPPRADASPPRPRPSIGSSLPIRV